MTKKALKSNYHIMRSKNKSLLFIFLIVLLNFLLFSIDLYLEKNYIYRILNLKNPNSLTLENKNTFNSLNDSDEIKLYEYKINDKKVYTAFSFFENNKLYKLKKASNLKLIMSHLNLQSYLENNISQNNFKTLFLFNMKLNTTNYCNTTFTGWDFIILDKSKNKLILVKYIKPRFTLSLYNFESDTILSDFFNLYN